MKQLEEKIALVTGGTRNVGKGIALVCDHENDEAVKKVFEKIIEKESKLDILVNNAWGGYNRLRNRTKYKGFKWKEVFWQQPIALWDEMNNVGVRSNFVASVYASEIMKKTGQIQVSALLGKEYGFTDIDGTQPEPYDEL